MTQVAITGAAGGIGGELARLMTSRGARVTAFDVVEPAASVASFIATDLADPASIDRALASAPGPFDALCNVAGLPPRNGLEATILAVNFTGLRRFTNGMLEKLPPGASIVNLASRAGSRWGENIDQVKALLALLDDADLAAFVADKGIDPVRAYDLSKEALIVWTMVRTADLAERGLRMNCISPAAVQTGILDDFMAAFGERAARGIALAGRAGTAAEIAQVAAFLISPESGWIKGANLTADGGLEAMVTTDKFGLDALACRDRAI